MDAMRHWLAGRYAKRDSQTRIPCQNYRKDRRRSCGGTLYSAQPSVPVRFRNLCADQLVGLRASFASMHSVAWGTFISRSLGISFPVVLQMP